MEKDKGRERVRDGGRGVLVIHFSVFTRRSRSVFLYLYGVFLAAGSVVVVFVCFVSGRAQVPSAQGTHFARWFGASNPQLLRRRDSIVRLFSCVS